MSEHAYDITYLLDAEPVAVEATHLRAVQPSLAAPPQPSLAAVQEALARELMQADSAHEAMIQQYTRIMGDALPDVGGR
jgi:hypothetical protein